MIIFRNFLFFLGLTALLACVPTTGTVQKVGSERFERGLAIVETCRSAACRTLDLDGAALADFTVLGEMSHVRSLMVSYTNLADLGDIDAMTQLEELHVGNAQFSNLNGLANFPKLRVLHLQNAAKVTDYSPIGRLANLEELAVGTYYSTSIGFVTGLKKLQRLKLISVEPIDLAPLKGLAALRDLDMTEAGLPTDLSALRALPRLKRVALSGLFDDMSETLKAQILDLKRRGVVVEFSAPIVVVC